LENL